MKKKRAPNKKRTTFRSRLGDVEEKLDDVLRRHADDIVTIGGLLKEAKDMIGRGRWLPWLKDRFSMSERSAQRYMKASAFAKSVTVTDFRKCNLSPGALYLLSEDRHWKQRGGIVDDGRRIATEAVLKEASQKRVGEDRADEIIEKALADMAAAEEADPLHAPRPEPEAEPENDPEESPPPPPPPPPGPLPRDRYLAEKFAAAILELMKLTTKSSAKFVGVIPPNDLELIANFLNQIAAGTKARAA
jgi:hypothetical protein